MALEERILTVSFAQGVDTKTDPKQVLPGKLLQLVNGRFITSQSIRKRNGTQALGSGIQGSTPVSGGAPSLSALSACASFKNELLGFTGNELYSYSPTTTMWSDKGAATSNELSVFPVIRNAYSQTLGDSAYLSGIIASVWEDSRGGIRYSVQDATTLEYYQQDVSIASSNATRPKVFALGNNFIFLYHNTGTTNLKYAVLSVASPSSTLSFSNYATTILNAAPNYDGVVMNDTLYLAWNGTGGTVKAKSLNRTASAFSSELSVAGEAATNCIGIFVDPILFQIWVTYNDNTNQRAFVATQFLSTTLVRNPFTIEAQAAVNCTGYSQSSGNATIYYQVSAVATYNTYIRVNTATNAGVAGTAADFLRSVGLFTKPFAYNSVVYLGITYDSQVQPMYFVVDTTGRVVSKLADGVGGGLTTKAQLSDVSTISSGIFGFAYLQKDLLTTTGGTITNASGTVNLYNQTGIQFGQIDFTSQTAFLKTSIGNNLLFTGGILNSYDGVSVVEQGFHLFPEAVSVTNTTSGGALVAGTYQYSAVYEWVDNFGQINRSAPSIPTTIVVPAGSSLTFTADSTAGSTTLANVSSVTGLFVGQVITDSTSGGNLTAGTYITAVGTTTITLSAAAAGTRVGDTYATVYTNSEAITVPTLRVTQKKSPRAPISVVLYRTQASGTIFYRVSSVSSPTVNTTTADIVSFTDHVSDISLVGNEILYTTGGEIENIAPPAISLIATYGNRAMAVTSEDPLTFWYSKELIPGTPPQFSDQFTQTVDSRIVEITAISQLDDKFIQFGPNSIYYMTGSGPTSTGTQNDFSQSLLITSDVGCTNPRSVVTMPLGLMFQSGKGIYLLTRGLESVYIGADVEAYNDYSITGAVLIPNTNEVRFTTSNGVTLTYDYFFKQWVVDEVQYGADACIFQNLFTYANPNGTMFQETVGSYTDNSNFYPLRIWTSWLSFAGLQGFQRVWQFLLLGSYKSPHTLQVRLAYDFMVSAIQEESIDATTLLGTGVYGSDATYGDTTPYGGNGSFYQFRITPNQQKCQAIQVQIEDVQTSDYGEGFSLSALSFMLGVKQGQYKSSSAVTFS